MRIFVALGDLWGLSELQRRLVLGFPSRATYYLWCKRARSRASLTLSLDVLCRISTVLSIQQALETLYADDDGNEWIHECNAAFDKQVPLDLIASGLYENLLGVYHFLRGELGDQESQSNKIADALLLKDVFNPLKALHVRQSEQPLQ